MENEKDNEHEKWTRIWKIEKVLSIPRAVQSVLQTVVTLYQGGLNGTEM